MKAIVCELCGSNSVVKSDEFFVCENCGTKYTVEQAKTLLQDVKLDRSEELSNLLLLGKRAHEDGNYKNAENYYEQALVINPNDWQAYFYQTLNQALNTNLLNVNNSVNSLINCLLTVGTMINKNEPQDKHESCFITMATELVQFSDTIKENVQNHFNSYNQVSSAISDYLTPISHLMVLALTFNATIKAFIPNNENVRDHALAFLKRVLIYRNSAIRYIELFRPTYIAVGGGKPDKLTLEVIDQIRVYETDYEPKPLGASENTSQGGKSGCYIATCVYGSYNSPSVFVLRRYRDTKLRKTISGKAFIKLYYRLSPRLVEKYGHNRAIVSIWRYVLNIIVTSLKHWGYNDSPYNDV